MRAGLDCAQMPSHVFAAQMLDELLDYLGYEGDAKEQVFASIDEYNQMCTAGKDTAFGKDLIALVPVSEAPFFGTVSQNTGADTSMGMAMTYGCVLGKIYGCAITEPGLLRSWEC